MRTAFAQTLMELAQEDSRIYLLIGDVGFGVFEPFAQAFPDRFVNVGVAEANLTGIAAGLALSGIVPFTYSIGNFPTLRCLEQVRNDVCYNDANVKLVAVGGGVAYGALGATHHATEDLAIMRALPNMIVVSPGDPIETRLATRAARNLKGPMYLRLGRAGEPRVHSSIPDFCIGEAIEVRAGDDITLIATGGILHTCLLASDKLQSEGISSGVLSMHTLKPLDHEAVAKAARETEAIFTVEEHSVVGGLGSAVADVLVELEGPHPIFKPIGLPDAFSHLVGSQDYLRTMLGLSADGIAETVLNTLRAKRATRVKA